MHKTEYFMRTISQIVKKKKREKENQFDIFGINGSN